MLSALARPISVSAFLHAGDKAERVHAPPEIPGFLIQSKRTRRDHVQYAKTTYVCCATIYICFLNGTDTASVLHRRRAVCHIDPNSLEGDEKYRYLLGQCTHKVCICF